MVADGCSSSPNTDVGARLLIHCLLYCLHNEVDAMTSLNQRLFNLTIKKARILADQLLIPLNALDCTLLVAACTQDQVQIMGFGDGVIAMYDHEDKILSGVEIIYPNQTPAYLNYHADQGRYSSYLTQDEGVQHRNLGSEMMRSYTNGLKIFTLERATTDIKSIILCSDGIASFPQLSVEEALVYLARFPTTQGAFVQRRLNKFIRKKCAQEGWHHSDDLAIAAVCF